MHDILCDNMREVMPMVVRNPYFKYSESNPLIKCNTVSNMRGRDLSFFNGATPVGLPVENKKGNFDIIVIAGTQNIILRKG